MMTVRWSPGAKTALDEATSFIEREFGIKARTRFKLEVRRINNLLKTNPNLGQIEPLLVDRPTTYHSIVVNRLNKMVYRIMEDHIEIADFWDVRREPKTLVNQIRI